MNKLLSKQGKSITLLAQMLLRAQSGDRLPAMQQLAIEQEVSVGTVQAAMQYLQTSSVITVENRGRLGAFVQELDYPRLWALAYGRAMSGMLPMPYTRRLEGLATALRLSFEELSLNVALRFIRGSTARIQGLHTQQCDWTVVSRYAADAAWAHGFNIQVIMALGAGTYTVDHVLLLNGSEELRQGMRVGIDTHSADHAFVVRSLSRGVPVQFVEIDYSAGLDLLTRGEIDATVWTEHDLPVLPDHIHVQTLHEQFTDAEHLAQLGEAVIVALPDNQPVAHVLHAALNIDKLRGIQDDVLAGRRRATY